VTAAARAAERGFHVFPCKVNDKTPAVPGHKEADCDGSDPRCRGAHTGWELRATTDPERIARGWAKAPYNIGVACGPSGLVVVDLDVPKPGKPMPEEWADIPGIVDGKDVFAYLCEHAGLTGWPSTYTVVTPTGGMHLYYRAPEAGHFRNTAGFLGPMIDTRAEGGYVVGAGSVIDGREYEITNDGDVEPLPAWLAQALAPAQYPPDKGRRSATFDLPSGPGRLAALERTVAAGQPGERTSVLVWAAFRLRDMIADGTATELDGDRLVSAAVAAGINGGEHYARGQVRSVLGRAS